MKIPIFIKPGAASSKLEYNPWRGWEVSLRSKAKDGRANEELLEFLAQKVGCPVSEIKIISGETSRRKTVEMPENEVFSEK